ncbi:hypothetical protein M407DRAFT_199280 [Tulasnella calospora MUT 4182]|uniref:Uncharacterized protein n=1 Tax=Tulasnella calospora MUT 4182 TaxID=1051891 RepID=A0A0C3QWR8_9AGAM|nr:hypothetical protein M407DRAFT_199280 [Tulasnella calospora MUT 4182]
MLSQLKKLIPCSAQIPSLLLLLILLRNPPCEKASSDRKRASVFGDFNFSIDCTPYECTCGVIDHGSCASCPQQ